MENNYKHIDHNLIEYCKCKPISNEHKQYMIQNDMLYDVLKNIHLYEK
jgi:hypothetical protein